MGYAIAMQEKFRYNGQQWLNKGEWKSARKRRLRAGREVCKYGH
ncbi:MAG: hypothetical protein U0O05_06580 [Dorea phocaeensis]